MSEQRGRLSGDILGKERMGRSMDKLVDGWITGKINDSSRLIGGSSRN